MFNQIQSGEKINAQFNLEIEGFNMSVSYTREPSKIPATIDFSGSKNSESGASSNISNARYSLSSKTWSMGNTQNFNQTQMNSLMSSMAAVANEIKTTLEASFLFVAVSAS